MVDNREDQSEPISKTHKRSRLFGDRGGKLCIKLNIPKEEADLGLAQEDVEEVKYKMNGTPDCEDDDSQLQFINDNNNISSTNIVFSRICQVCTKGFRSGKALGGHMRVHFQTKKEAIPTKKLSEGGQPIIKFKKQKREISDLAKKKRGGTASSPEKMKKVQVPTCFLCSKRFPSPKSLCGHMRCHPEREWRGILPPETIKASPFSSVSNPELQNMSNHDDDDQVDSATAVAVVEGEVDLAKLLGGWSVTAKRSRKTISGEDDDGMRNAVFHLMSLARGDGYKEFEGTNSNSLTCKAEELSKSKKEISGNIAKAVRETEFFDGKLEDRKCKWDVPNACGETSSNGNFMVLKSKKRRKKMKLRDLESVHDHSSSPAAHQNPVNSPEKFRCTTCDKSFPTHQALGGHRSSHNKFRIIIHNAGEEDDEDATGGRRVMNFDLNEEPPVEDESSSYNSVEY